MKTLNHEQNAFKIIKRELKKDFIEGPVPYPLCLYQDCQNWKGIFGTPVYPILYEITYDIQKETYLVERYQKYGKGAYSLDELEDQGK